MSTDRQISLDRNGDGNPLPDARAYERQSPPTADTSPPTVVIKAPAAGGTVSGATRFMIDAADNVGVKHAKWSATGSRSGYRDGLEAGTKTTAPAHDG